ncbi:uncharacterized protein LOC131614173 [Vicia villosa]|uniref:uncharacterized protein LOC131614173 n=1 Tax=Vicia villosa TaxID=3911 RepID=UPI00273B2348|nr:uncharacterized protein LOC131614173 [Vicia villosa]
MPMILKEWRIDFNLKRDLMRTIPIWVKLPQLPLHLWGVKSLNKIGSAIGTPLDVEGRLLKQEVEYEWKPSFCEKFQKLGHQCQAQRKIKQWQPKKKPPDDEVQKTLTKPTEEPEQGTKDDTAESWTVVKRNSNNKENIVKQTKANVVRAKLHLTDQYIDNYRDHKNGRIWLGWDNNKVDVQFVQSTSQLIHCRVDDAKGVFKYWLTAVYAHNQLDKRKKLWRDIEQIQSSLNGPWCVIDDFNNVAKARDHIGGILVTKKEYSDMQNMMMRTGTSEMDSSGDFFTWFNKHFVGPIYFRIDKLLGNMDWFQANPNIA